MHDIHNLQLDINYKCWSRNCMTHNNGDAMLLIFGAAIVLIVFFIIDIISLISGKKQKGYLLPGYVGVSIGVKCIAILFLVLAYIFKLRI